MRKMKKFLTLAMTATLLFSSMTVNAAEVSMTSKQNADYMMSTNKDGAPNWFNGAYYSDRYEDLKIAFNTNEKALYNHSLQYGFNESRLVTPVLDVAKYRDFYPDLNKAFGDNWNLYVRHYFEYGINEGRENFTDFDAKTYLSMYDDLQNAFGTDLGLATRHYIEYGISEGRDYNWVKVEVVWEEPDNDNTETGFTGDKRVELEGGSYIIETYVDDVLTSIKIYDENGNLLEQITYTYDSNGNITSEKITRADGYSNEITYENGNKALEKTTYVDGSTSETTYENGVRTYQVDIYANGTKYEAEYYEDGQTIKKSTTTYNDGTKMVGEFYENGNWKSRTDYDKDGNITYQAFYDGDGNITETDYTTATPSNATPTE